jgi:hypothetical protein
VSCVPNVALFYGCPFLIAPSVFSNIYLIYLILVQMNTKWAIKNGQSRETGHTGNTRRRNTKQKHTTSSSPVFGGVCVAHHYICVCYSIVCLYVLCPVLWCPSRFPHGNLLDKATKRPALVISNKYFHIFNSTYG